MLTPHHIYIHTYSYIKDFLHDFEGTPQQKDFLYLDFRFHEPCQKFGQQQSTSTIPATVFNPRPRSPISPMSSSNLRSRCLRIAAFVGPIWMLIGCWIQGFHRRAYPSDRVLTTVGSSVTNINSTRNPQKPKYVLLDFGFIRFRADLRICQEVGLSGLRCLEETPAQSATAIASGMPASVGTQDSKPVRHSNCPESPIPLN